MTNSIKIATCALLAFTGCKKKQQAAPGEPAPAKAAEASSGCAADALKVPDQGFCVTAPGYKVDSTSKEDDGTVTVNLWKPGNTIIVKSNPTWTMPEKMSDVLGNQPGDTVTEGTTPNGAKWRSVKHGTVETVSVYLKSPKSVYACGVSGSDIKETFDVCKSLAAL